MDERNPETEISKEDARREYEARVAEAVEAARCEWETEVERRVNAARAEGERVAGLSAEERLQERERALAGRERELARRELRAEALQELAGRGLPGELADALSYEDREACRRSMEQTERAFRAAVQAGISQRLGAMPPAVAAGVVDAEKLTDEQYYTARGCGRM